MSLPTPAYRLSIEQRDSVYEPAEDTFLLLDAIEKDIKKIRALAPSLVMEIGCGSGVVSTFVAQNLGPSTFCIASDLNPMALQCTRQTSRMNGVTVDVVRTDLYRGMRGVEGKIDLLLFNPPYVPTEEEAKSDVELTWAGGVMGRSTLDRLLPSVPSLLSDHGMFYLVALHQNDIPMLLAHNEKLKGEVVMERRCGIERLYILRFTKI